MKNTPLTGEACSSDPLQYVTMSHAHRKGLLYVRGIDKQGSPRGVPWVGDRFLSSAGAGGKCVLSMRVPNPSPALDKNCAPPWVQKFYPVLGLGSGERLLWHFQTPVLYWINFNLRNWEPSDYVLLAVFFPFVCQKLPEEVSGALRPRTPKGVLKVRLKKSRLRGPAAILFIWCDTSSDSIANSFC